MGKRSHANYVALARPKTAKRIQNALQDQLVVCFVMLKFIRVNRKAFLIFDVGQTV
jgi:hypothetical protein